MGASVKLFDDLDAVERDAGGALDRAAQPCLFDRLDWYRLVARHTPPEGKIMVLRAEEGGSRSWLFLGGSGGRAQALVNWYSLRFGAVQLGSGLYEALADGLRASRIGAIELHPLPPGDPLASALRQAGWLVRTAPATVTWRMTTAGMSFDNYWKQRPARLRNTAERKAKAAALDISIDSHFTDAAWSDYEAVYDASWKPGEGSPAFLRQLAEQEGAAGTLRLGLARQAGRPIAAQLWLVETGIATIHKLAYAQDAKALSPGTLLSQAMFRHALDVDGVQAIDFGLGDDAYKADWIDSKARMERLVAYDVRRPRGLAALAAHVAGKLVRSRPNG